MKMFKHDEDKNAGLVFDEDEYEVLIAIVQNINFVNNNDIHKAVAFIDSLRTRPKRPTLFLIKSDKKP